MKEKDKVELFKTLQGFSFDAILEVLSVSEQDSDYKKAIKEFVLDNFEEKSSIRLEKSIKELEDEFFKDDTLKKKIRILRICASKIIDGLKDFGDINSTQDIETIISTPLMTAKNGIEALG